MVAPPSYDAEMRLSARRPALVMALAILPACASVSPGLAGAMEPDRAALPPCNEATTLIWSGRTSLAALDLGDMTGPGEANRPGQVWVTAPFAPRDMGPGPMHPEAWLCVEWDDGSGMATTVPPDWQPPTGLTLTGGGSPLPVVAALGLVALCVVVSFLAFRRG